MTWVLILWAAATILFIVLVNTAANDDVRAECIAEATSQTQRDLCDVGTSLASGVWTVIAVVLGFGGFLVLGLIWLMTRPRRHCPACGRDVKKGVTSCRKCGYLLTATSVRPAMPGPPSHQWAPPPPPPPPASTNAG